MPRLVYFMYKGLKNAMSFVLYMRDFLYNDLSLLPIKLFVFFNFIMSKIKVRMSSIPLNMSPNHPKPIVK